jgi:hypothetical protein
MLRPLAALALLASHPAWACFVCGQVSEQGQGAYLWMTAIMSALPLVAMGSIGFWVVRRVLRHDRAMAAERLAASAAPAADRAEP